MAYSGRITITGYSYNFIVAFSEFIRFIAGDPSTPGRDWTLIYHLLDDSANNFQWVTFSGTINVEALNTWYNLPTICVTEETITRGGQTLTRNVDYELDWFLGRIRFLTGTPPYTVSYSYRFKRYQMVFRNTGLSGTEQVLAGFLLLSSGFDRGNVMVRCFKFWDSYMNFWESTHSGNPGGSSGQPMFGFWNGGIDMWIFSNKQRIIVVVRNNTYYSFAYVGQFFRLMTPYEYPQPLWVQGDLWGNADLGSTIWFDSTDGARQALHNPRKNPGWINGFTNVWTSDFNFVPTQLECCGTQIAYYPGLNRVLFPLYILTAGNQYTIGTPDGIYWFPGNTLAAESSITIGNSSYIIFPNCWRTGWTDWIAIKEE